MPTPRTGEKSRQRTVCQTPYFARCRALSRSAFAAIAAPRLAFIAPVHSVSSSFHPPLPPPLPLFPPLVLLLLLIYLLVSQQNALE